MAKFCWDPPASASRCKHCNKHRWEHKVITLHCPIGQKHKTVGYTFYDSVLVYAPKEIKKKEEVGENA